MNKQWLAAVSLAPLLGATQTLHNAGAIAGLSVLVITLHHLAMSPLHRWLDGPGRLIASVLLSAGLTTCLELGLRTWALPLYLALGPYPALIAVQCLVFEHARGDTQTLRQSAIVLLGFAALALGLGAGREFLAQWAGIRLAALLPGALILMGLLLALYNRVCHGRAPLRRQGNL
ncbi:electron transport complex RsxE subunit [compost metagenome]|uniref:Rnf-Nqr domain containing protein n=1 Tax=Pseudomonas TaxID=286 RepID=UPI000CFBB4FC|nr:MULTISPECIES: Rnf-Nqr domain containing protein [unclassified Pseudomonas]MCW2270084.1 electron transport complex protein RnfE [Pseudomonas sp. JUb96]PRA61543.1 NADH:quinone oxidoreductase [Pseudomonas sp. MYb187]